MDCIKYHVLAGKECEQRCLFCPYSFEYREVLKPTIVSPEIKEGSKIKDCSEIKEDSESKEDSRTNEGSSNSEAPKEDKDLVINKSLVAKKEVDKKRKLLTISGKNPFSSYNVLKLIEDNYNGFEEITIFAPGYSFLDLALIEQLKKYKKKLLIKVMVLSHRRDVHDLITSSRDSWAKSCKAILLLKKNDFNVRVCTVMTKINYFYLKEMPFFVKTLGLNEWELSYVKPVGRALENIEMLMPAIDMAIPFLEDVLYQASENEITVYIKDIPFCILEKTRSKGLNVEFSSENEIFEKPLSCKECLKNAACKGFFKEYFKMFDIKANEILKPIK